MEGSAIDQKSFCKIMQDDMHHEGMPSMAKDFFIGNMVQSNLCVPGEVPDNLVQTSPETKEVARVTPCVKHLISEFEFSFSNCSLESGSVVPYPGREERVMPLENHISSQSMRSYHPSNSIQVYTSTSTLYAEANASFTNTEASKDESAVENCGKSVRIVNSYEVEGQKTNVFRRSTDSDVRFESSSSCLSSAWYKPHKANDKRWRAIQAVRSRDGALEFNHFSLLMRIGCGDIGTVFLSELIGTETYFAIKFMNKEVLAARKKLPRAQTEREILQALDHPFLPTLYTHFDTETVSCLVMEFCPGGDLHILRQKQPGKCFPEHAARFYVAEVLLAMEYLHMLGIIYRDLKPENVLVREDGHIMLSDFDLSLRSAVRPILIKSSKQNWEPNNPLNSACLEPAPAVQSDCAQQACYGLPFTPTKSKKHKWMRCRNVTNNSTTPLPELVAEPTSARSMSFVGTHEYLAPEIIKGEGHGSAVDWWTVGIFLYELLFGKTPFKGSGNRATLFNVVGQPLRFPESPPVGYAARDLIRGLLVKDPEHRLGCKRGATELKQHPFFQSINWALIRCTKPPQVPRHSMVEFLALANSQNVSAVDSEDVLQAANVKPAPADINYDVELF